jgi:hypothetical protein
MPEPGTALVSFGTRSWTLREGRLLAYGREPDRHIRIPDPRVSARAGLLFMRSGWVWVRHDSLSHGLVISEPGTRPQVVPKRRAGRPGPSRPLLSAVCELELMGRTGVLRIRVNQPRYPDPPLAVAEAPADVERTESLRSELTVDERRILAALCEGLLRSGGVGEPVSTREVAVRLDLTRKAAENRLTRLRSKLTSLGVDGLQSRSLGLATDDEPEAGEDGPGAQAANYVAHLGRLAYAHGWVLDDDLGLLLDRR